MNFKKRDTKLPDLCPHCDEEFQSATVSGEHAIYYHTKVKEIRYNGVVRDCTEVVEACHGPSPHHEKTIKKFNKTGGLSTRTENLNKKVIAEIKKLLGNKTMKPDDIRLELLRRGTISKNKSIDAIKCLMRREKELFQPVRINNSHHFRLEK